MYSFLSNYVDNDQIVLLRSFDRSLCGHATLIVYYVLVTQFACYLFSFFYQIMLLTKFEFFLVVQNQVKLCASIAYYVLFQFLRELCGPYNLNVICS